jgi:hypothetical protein
MVISAGNRGGYRTGKGNPTVKDTHYADKRGTTAEEEKIHFDRRQKGKIKEPGRIMILGGDHPWELSQPAIAHDAQIRQRDAQDHCV